MCEIRVSKFFEFLEFLMESSNTQLTVIICVCEKLLSIYRIEDLLSIDRFFGVFESLSSHNTRSIKLCVVYVYTTCVLNFEFDFTEEVSYELGATVQSTKKVNTLTSAAF